MAEAGFRATQPPSKVLHIRNLPFEAQEDELHALCTPFGKIFKTKMNVGPSKNQAFVEFVDISAAINMISYYSGSAEPAKVRGKTVYLQYSTRQEIVNSTGQGESPSNVLLVTMDVPAKIATFEKAAGFQALVQYGDVKEAEEARDYLDGRMVPKYLLPDGSTAPQLRLSFSAHNDLNVKFQSHRSRDYTNPYLPVATSTTDPNISISDPVNPAGVENNVLLAQVDNVGYPVMVDALHTVFSPYGAVQKIAIFEKNGQWQALVQYADGAAAAVAKEALEGHAIYDGGYNKLKITYSVHRDLNVKSNNERGWDYTIPSMQPPPQPPPGWGYGGGGHGGAYGAGHASTSVGYHPVTATQLPPEVIVTGQDYEDAHNEVVRCYKELAERAAAGDTSYGTADPAAGPPHGGPGPHHMEHLPDHMGGHPGHMQGAGAGGMHPMGPQQYPPFDGPTSGHHLGYGPPGPRPPGMPDQPPPPPRPHGGMGMGHMPGPGHSHPDLGHNGSGPAGSMGLGHMAQGPGHMQPGPSHMGPGHNHIQPRPNHMQPGPSGHMPPPGPSHLNPGHHPGLAGQGHMQPGPSHMPPPGHMGGGPGHLGPGHGHMGPGHMGPSGLGPGPGQMGGPGHVGFGPGHMGPGGHIGLGLAGPPDPMRSGPTH